jgi:hypothetical protein
MEESHGKDLASHPDPESCACGREAPGEALTGAHAGQPSSRETMIQWHRQGFKLYWRWKSRARKPGRPCIHHQLRNLIRRMSRENPLWGAPRILSELLLLGYKVAQGTVAK